jgi:hypothetical protein
VISTRKDIPRIDRLDFFVSVMKEDGSLKCVEYASRYFEQETGQKIKYLYLSVILAWWETHRSDFVAPAKTLP